MSVMGIDLGTTFSCVAIYQNGRAEILPNRLGNRITPSCVSFADGRRLIGEAAANKATSNHKNTIFDAKRLIGRDFNDTIVQNDMKNWPFKVANVNGKPMFEVESSGELKRRSPEEISAAVLYEMKLIAQKYLGKPVRKAVVTVPAYFNNSQRQATKSACEIAELDVLRIINEPTAAAIAYGFNNQFEDRRTILVYDLGGGTFDVTILEIDDGVFDVKSTGGDTHLGGQDFTLKIVDHFCEKIMTKDDYDIKKDLKALGRLRQECEKAKICLSSMGETEIDIDNLYNGKDLHDKISRALFEGLNIIDFRRTLEVVNQALADAKMKAEDIDEVVLVGGSSRIPKIRNLVQDLFGGKIHQNIHPDEAVAIGATIMAAKLAERPAELQEIVINDVTPLSLGVEVVGGLMSVITPRNTTIPTKISKSFTTHEDNQTNMKLSVYEGERPLIRDNDLLGKFILDGIPPQKRRTRSIIVTFEINSDGILSVVAVDKSTGNEKSITIQKNEEHLSSAEIKRLIGEAKVYLEDDKAEKERVEAKMKVEELCLEKKSEIMYSRTKNALSENVKEQIKSECNTMLKWLERNEAATKEDYQVKLEQLTRTFQRLFK